MLTIISIRSITIKHPPNIQNSAHWLLYKKNCVIMISLYIVLYEYTTIEHMYYFLVLFIVHKSSPLGPPIGSLVRPQGLFSSGHQFESLRVDMWIEYVCACIRWQFTMSFFYKKKKSSPLAFLQNIYLLEFRRVLKAKLQKFKF